MFLGVKKPAGTAEEVEKHFGCKSSQLIMVKIHRISIVLHIMYFLFCRFNFNYD